MDLAANLNSIQQRIDAACRKVGRPPKSVTLQAVSKGQPPEAVRAA
ncbi:MAG TPA: YggS family pyridoxal phosphate-dependent enzyme, partial [Verrucomicrobiae bacterium]|nr:YggS family pyridoxal phosphate-dependent enzyme [Verrucomicrobiae bacterium]